MNKQANYVVLQNNHVLLIKNAESFTLPTGDELSPLMEYISCVHQVGFHQHIACFCAEISKDFQLSSAGLFVPIKQAISVVDNAVFPLIVKSIHLLDWNNNNKYCGFCGNHTLKNSEIFEAQCTVCEKVFYPRISPSIIVLIRKGKQILMARGPHFAEGVYGLIAGFVSPGETLEEAVEREVFEEVGIKIKNIRYFGSQPWPFPDSLMVAFLADFDSGEIQIDNVEIIEAGWYSADKLPGRTSSAKSIATLLVNYYINNVS